MLKKTLVFHEKPSKHLTVLSPETVAANIKIYEQIRRNTTNPTDSDPQIVFCFVRLAMIKYSRQKYTKFCFK